MIYIMPYKLGSESARALAQQLQVKRIKGEKKMKSFSTIINWGKIDFSTVQRTLKIINPPTAVSKARNKISTFQTLRMAGISIPDFTTNSSEAKQWLDEDTFLYGRRYTESQEGRGIEIITMDDSHFPILPLYTKAITKCHEYRVHVMAGQVLDYSKKRKRNESEANPYIKNFSNGWVFCREGIALPSTVSAQAIAAVKALGLDFGAVDVLYKERDNKAFVLEVNTAPGLEGTTLQKYVEGIRRHYVNRSY